MTQLEQIKDALEKAKRYQDEVYERSLSLHNMAGPVNFDTALNIINTMLAAKMRTPEEIASNDWLLLKEDSPIAFENTVRSIKQIQDEALAAGLAAQGEWQPIESAPKDGTFVDLWVYHPDYGTKGYRVTNCKFIDGHWYEKFGRSGPVEGFLQTDGTYLIHPTHWQPLPAPPSKEGA